MPKGGGGGGGGCVETGRKGRGKGGNRYRDRIVWVGSGKATDRVYLILH